MILTDSWETRAKASRIIQTGKVIAYRTDTFYGLGADPLNPDGAAAVNALKGRQDKPILVICGNMVKATCFILETSYAWECITKRYWPGPLTLVMRAREDLPPEITSGTKTIGLRLPAAERVVGLVNACGGALTATSANPAGLPPALTGHQAEKYFPHGLALVVDGGAATSDKPSSILDLTGSKPRCLREGIIPKSDIMAQLNKLGLDLI